MLCHNTDRIVGHITDNFIELQEKHRKIVVIFFTGLQKPRI